MIRMRHRRAVSAFLLGTCLALGAGLGAASAGATTDDDQRFAQIATELGVPSGPGVDLPAVGHGICNMLTTGLQANAVNPVPVVRGVVSQLQAGGLSRAQSASLMRAAAGIYCPEHAALLGR
jgi:ABC-type transporter lipoprotein component MlaA